LHWKSLPACVGLRRLGPNGPDDAEPVVTVPLVRVGLVPLRRPQVLGNLLPVAAAEGAVRGRLDGRLEVAALARLVDVPQAAVVAPLADVAEDVEQAPRVRAEGPDRPAQLL